MQMNAEYFRQILKDKFHHEDFRGDQLPIIQTVMKSQSALAIMPTGMGKSLCYQLPSTLLEGLVLVISPLVALMQDQVDKAQALGLDAIYINSSLSSEKRQSRQTQIAEGKYKILFVTPERFRKPEFLQSLSQRKISLLVIDEAHCISQWGHDFRPEYARLGEIRKWLKSPTTLAMTATATPAVQKEILHVLDIPDASVYASGIRRPNLSLHFHEVHGQDEKVRAIVGLRHQHPGCGIIYFSLISTLQSVSSELARLGIRHFIYHGNQKAEERKKQQKKFFQEKDSLMLSTPAFGLGIDKPDVRLLVHFEVPGSIESYFQEVGRAGRDGQIAFGHCLVDNDDLSIQMEFIKWANPDAHFIRQVFYLIKDHGLRVQQEGFDFLREQMNFYNRRDFRVETAVNLLLSWGCLQETSSRFGYEAVVPPDENLLQSLHSEERIRCLSEKLHEFYRLTQQREGCRQQSIYQYFGYESEPCGICDLCQSQKK